MNAYWTVHRHQAVISRMKYFNAVLKTHCSGRKRDVSEDSARFGIQHSVNIVRPLHVYSNSSHTERGAGVVDHRGSLVKACSDENLKLSRLSC